VDALLALLDAHPASVVVPAHDGSIDAIRKRRSEVAARAALALANNDALAIAISKEHTLSLAKELGIMLPETITGKTEHDVRRAAASLGYPVVVKPSESWAEGEQEPAKRLYSTIARDETEALTRAERILSRGIPALIQGWLSGRREAV